MASGRMSKSLEAVSINSSDVLDQPLSFWQPFPRLKHFRIILAYGNPLPNVNISSSWHQQNINWLVNPQIKQVTFIASTHKSILTEMGTCPNVTKVVLRNIYQRSVDVDSSRFYKFNGIFINRGLCFVNESMNTAIPKDVIKKWVFSKTDDRKCRDWLYSQDLLDKYQQERLTCPMHTYHHANDVKISSNIAISKRTNGDVNLVPYQTINFQNGSRIDSDPIKPKSIFLDNSLHRLDWTFDIITMQKAIEPPTEFIDLILKFVKLGERWRNNQLNDNDIQIESESEQLLNDYKSKQGDDLILSWLLYLVLNGDTIISTSTNVKRMSLHLLDRELKKYIKVKEWEYNQKIVKNIFYSSSIASSSSSELNLIISILRTLLIKNNCSSKYARDEFIEFIENVIKSGKDKPFREIILKIIESFRKKYLRSNTKKYLLPTFCNIATSFLTDNSNHQYQLRALNIIHPMKKTTCAPNFTVAHLLRNNCQFQSPTFKFSHDTVVQALVDRIDIIIENHKNDDFISTVIQIIQYIDQNQYKYVSYRIGPILLKRYKSSSSSIDQEFMKISILGKHFFKCLFELINYSYSIGKPCLPNDWQLDFDIDYFSIYLAPIMKSIIQTQSNPPSIPIDFLNTMVPILYPYWKHLVGPICSIECTTNIMSNMLALLVSKEGFSKNSFTTFNLFIDSLMDPSGTGNIEKIFGEITKMIEMIQGGVWTYDQLLRITNLFIERDNKYQDWKYITQESISNHAKLHHLLAVHREEMVLPLSSIRISLSKILKYDVSSSDLPSNYHIVPTIIWKWKLLCDYENDKASAAVEYYQQIIPLLFDRLSKPLKIYNQYEHQVWLQNEEMMISLWQIVNLLSLYKESQLQQQYQLHFDNICNLLYKNRSPMLLDALDKLQSDDIDTFKLEIKTLFNIKINKKQILV
ncbi:hypothetical protein DFA_06893 [Cavenderia fasciculata]|uniref:Uncharacterized protein n=1 Tax=Cavenderia fasciculata TaxID=261658 RepID=F4PWY8_CACFS|nr:uncharacterized protein DFA_06893 [Cavenderia fasciculata]EGG19791.1 hypothetical protein DFA_06893 [Cavenderia fasciculata]|eukprot:XP_004358137.1 hypothetical protein DFA_06893 [Cavenderia fasciculata]